MAILTQKIVCVKSCSTYKKRTGTEMPVLKESPGRYTKPGIAARKELQAKLHTPTYAA